MDDEEIAAWRDAAAAMHIPYDEELGVHPQSEGFTRHQEWDFANTPQDHYPLLLHYPYFDLYRKQVIKQADLVFAMYVRGTPSPTSRRCAISRTTSSAQCATRRCLPRFKR